MKSITTRDSVTPSAALRTTAGPFRRDTASSAPKRTRIYKGYSQARWRKLPEHTPAQPIPGIVFSDEKHLPWIPSKFADGVEVKNLGKADGRAMQLVRFKPGASYPSHTHTDCEFLYVLNGEVFQNGVRLTAGCSVAASAGSIDETFISPNGCLFLLFYGKTQS